MSLSTVPSILRTTLLTSGVLLLNTGFCAPTDDFVTTWKTDNDGPSGDTEIMVPMVGGPYDVDWDGDGIFEETGLMGPSSHDFGVADTYTIRIQGDYDSIQFSNAGDKLKILSVDQWGTQSWTTMSGAFFGAANLQVTATDTPDFSAVMSMANMFRGASLANPDTSGWDTSDVRTMASMFSFAPVATPDTLLWDTSQVTDMSNIFFAASQADPDTSGWVTTNVTSMSGMFAYAGSADPDTSGWDTGAVTSMASMFNGATVANPDTSNWNTAEVTNMSLMFNGAKAAQPDTSGWNTAKVINMAHMFRDATLANPDTSTWNTGAVTDMSYMFRDTSANPNTSAWDTSNVKKFDFMFYRNAVANPNTSGWNTSNATTMEYMFSATSAADPDTTNWNTSAVENMQSMFQSATLANPETGNWDTSAVLNMSSMFSQASSANPDTSGWDTGAVTTMASMFLNAVSFDRDIGSWDVSALTDAAIMFKGVTLSPANYDSLLLGWSGQALNPGVTFDGGDSKYWSCEAGAARASMISSSSWVITDGGFITPCRVDEIYDNGFEDDETLVYQIGFCRLQFPNFIDGTEGTNVDVYGRLFISGLTDQSETNDPAPEVIAYVGFGPDGSDPSFGWNWTVGTPNPGYGPGSGGYEAINDEYNAVLIIPSPPGDYDFAFRFSGDGGTTFTYCDSLPEGSSDGYSPANAGQMISQAGGG